MLVAIRPNHRLHREARVHVVEIAADVDRLQRVEERAAAVPRHVRRSIDHVVAVQRGDRNEADVRDLEARGEVLVLADDLVEAVLGPIDEVHLVDRDHQMLDAQEGGDE